jgi:hypothetical protein
MYRRDNPINTLEYSRMLDLFDLFDPNIGLIKAKKTTLPTSAFHLLLLLPPVSHLEILTPLVPAVVLGNLWLEEGVSGHGCGQPGQRLPPAAAHTYQQPVAARSAQHPADAGQVLQHIPAHGNNVELIRIKRLREITDLPPFLTREKS